MTFVKAFIGAVLLAIAAATLWLWAPDQKELVVEDPSTQMAAVVTVSMSDAAYSTTTIHIRQGEVIAFKNDGNTPRWPASDLHPTHEFYSDFDPRKPVEPGATWSFAYGRCGMWRFHDHLKPSVRGTIEVACPN